MWRHVRDMAVPDALAHKIAHFRRYGRLVSEGPELFLNPSWLAVHIGQFNMPERWEPMVDARPNVDAARMLSGLRRVMRDAAGDMPRHADVLARIAAGAAAPQGSIRAGGG